MGKTTEQALAELTEGFYRKSEYPALAQQMREWAESRPLAGLRVLDGTPVFRNTTLKYRALLAAGADLAVSAPEIMPCDPAVCDALDAAELRVFRNAPPVTEEFDVVLDCGAAHARVPSRFGYVELTRTGVHHYRELGGARRVFAADSGRIKAIETCLGTGESFLRALRQLGLGEVAGRRAVVFGCGKVGRGIVFYLLRAGAEVFAADFPEVLEHLPDGVAGIDVTDRKELEAVLARAQIVVTATGIRHALTGRFDMTKLAASDALIANMGVEDEYGDEMPEERVLNRKRPLNFILAEPTRLVYIETTMALHNAGALELLRGGSGMTEPPAALEERLLETSCRDGEVGGEIRELPAMLASERERGEEKR